jgi:hypothetical protein
LINRLSCANLCFKSPYEILYERKINLEHLKNLVVLALFIKID